MLISNICIHTHRHIYFLQLPITPFLCHSHTSITDVTYAHLMHTLCTPRCSPSSFSFLLCFPLLTHPTPASPSSEAHTSYRLCHGCSLERKGWCSFSILERSLILTHPCVGWMTLDKTFSLWGSVFIFSLMLMKEGILKNEGVGFQVPFQLKKNSFCPAI